MLKIKAVCDLCGKIGVHHDIESWYSVTKGFTFEAGCFVEDMDPKALELVVCDHCKARLASFYESAKSCGVKMKQALRTLYEVYGREWLDDMIP
jgi:hypothetical protein